MTFATLVLAMLAAPAPSPIPTKAGDWPQWRGPDRTDVSKETGLLKSWPSGGPKLLWTYKDAGTGYSSVAVVGNRIYCMGAIDGKEVVYAIDVKTHTKVWSSEIGPLYTNGWGDGPRGTPTVDGGMIYALGGQGNLVCLEAEGGKQVWLKRLKQDLGGEQMSGWGYSESPLVDGNLVLCTPGGSKGTLAAFDKKSGEVVWRSTEFTDKAGYASIMVSNACGVHQYTQYTGQNVVGISTDGKLLWKFERKSNVAAIPSLITSDDYVYTTSGYGAGCALLKITSTGGELKAEQVYANKNMLNHHGGVVLLNGHIYGYHGDNSPGKGWVCQDFLTGTIVWENKAKLGKGSVTCAEGKLYCYSEADGIAVLADASTKGWQEHGRFKIPAETKIPRKAGKIWTHPVVANGMLFLRDQDLIYCYDISAKQ